MAYAGRGRGEWSGRHGVRAGSIRLGKGRAAWFSHAVAARCEAHTRCSPHLHLSHTSGRRHASQPSPQFKHLPPTTMYPSKLRHGRGRGQRRRWNRLTSLCRGGGSSSRSRSSRRCARRAPHHSMHWPLGSALAQFSGSCKQQRGGGQPRWGPSCPHERPTDNAIHPPPRIGWRRSSRTCHRTRCRHCSAQPGAAFQGPGAVGHLRACASARTHAPDVVALGAVLDGAGHACRGACTGATWRWSRGSRSACGTQKACLRPARPAPDSQNFRAFRPKLRLHLLHSSVRGSQASHSGPPPLHAAAGAEWVARIM